MNSRLLSICRCHCLCVCVCVCVVCRSEHTVQDGELAASHLGVYRHLHDGRHLGRASALRAACSRTADSHSRRALSRHTRHGHCARRRLGDVRRLRCARTCQLQRWNGLRQQQPLNAGLPVNVEQCSDVRLLAVPARCLVPSATGRHLRQLWPAGWLSVESSPNHRCRHWTAAGPQC